MTWILFRVISMASHWTSSIGTKMATIGLIAAFDIVAFVNATIVPPLQSNYFVLKKAIVAFDKHHYILFQKQVFEMAFIGLFSPLILIQKKTEAKFLFFKKCLQWCLTNATIGPTQLQKKRSVYSRISQTPLQVQFFVVLDLGLLSNITWSSGCL